MIWVCQSVQPHDQKSKPMSKPDHSSPSQTMSDHVLPLANHTESHPGDITKRETLLSLGRQKHNMGQFDTKSIGCLRQSHCISGWQLATGWLHQSLLRGWSGVVVNKCKQDKQDKQVCFFCSPPFSGPLVQKLLSRGTKGSESSGAPWIHLASVPFPKDTP